MLVKVAPVHNAVYTEMCNHQTLDNLTQWIILFTFCCKFVLWNKWYKSYVVYSIC